MSNVTQLGAGICQAHTACLTVNAARLEVAVTEERWTNARRLVAYVIDDAKCIDAVLASCAVPAPTEDTDVPTLEEWTTAS